MYGNYFGNGQGVASPMYNPNIYGNNIMQPQQPMTTNSNMQQQQSQVATNKIFVSGIEDVKMRMQQPNSEMIYVDNDNSMIYQKSVDATGHFSVKAYTITEYQPESNSNNSTQYATQKEFEEMKNKISSLEAMIKNNGGSTSNGNTGNNNPQQLAING